jgi:hypothetical protein
MIRSALFVVFVFLCTGASAQHADSSASDGRTHAAFKFIVNFDSRNTEAFGRTVKFFGLRFGAQKGNDIVALGFYGLDNPLLDQHVQIEGVNKNGVDARTSLNYASLTYERILLDTKRWQLSVPLMAGLGNVKVDRRDSTESFRPFAKLEVIPLETGVRAAYKLWWWLHLQAGVGYRFVATTDARVKSNYSGPTWTYGISIKIGRIYDRVKDKLKGRKANKPAADGTQ